MPNPNATRSAGRILIVDDDPDLGDTLREILEDERWNVTVARSGEEALDTLGRWHADTVLVDARLPDMGGIELMRRLREIDPDLEIGILTGNATVQDAVAALNHGAARYILKPCDPDELKAIVTDLRERRLLRERARLYLRRLEVQNDLSDALSAAIRPEDVATAAVSAVRKLANAGVAVVAAPVEPAGTDPADAPRPKALAWDGMTPEEAVALTARAEVQEYLARGFGGTPGMVVIPGQDQPGGRNGNPVALYRLRGRSHDLGVLAVAVDRDRALDEHHWELLTAVANWVGVALERAMLHRRLEIAYNEVRNAQRRMVQTEKHSAIGRLAAGLAHEVGTPLNIISGRSEFMLEEVGETNPRVAAGLRTIVQQIDRITHLVGQLMDFAREYTPARERVSLPRVVAAVSELLDRAMANAETDFVAEVPDALPGVLANFNQMQQVLINLLMNSLDAILADPAHGKAKGRGRISVRADLVPRLGKVRVVVQDNGHGIREDHLDKVFDPFFSTKPVGKGTGLGLAVVYGIVTEHGGTIEVDSTWTEGTTITFTLPVEQT